MFTSIILGLAPFVLNAATEGAKWLTGFSSTAGKRFLLAVLAIFGAVSFSAINGTPLDVNSITSLIQVALEALLAFFAAHGTYSLITTPSTGPNA